MKMKMWAGVGLALLVAVIAFAETQRKLTPDELAQVTAFIAARDAKLTKENWSQIAVKNKRTPNSLIGEYERYKYDNAKRRWKSRPKFAGWDDKCYTWNQNGKSYRNQLHCSKCGKWVSTSGFSCGRHQPKIDQRWKFCVALIAKDHKKPMEATAHLWNAHQHKEITDAQWDACMAAIDLIVAAPAAKK